MHLYLNTVKQWHTRHTRTLELTQIFVEIRRTRTLNVARQSSVSRDFIRYTKTLKVAKQSSVSNYFIGHTRTLEV